MTIRNGEPKTIADLERLLQEAIAAGAATINVQDFASHIIGTDIPLEDWVQRICDETVANLHIPLKEGVSEKPEKGITFRQYLERFALPA
jgi:hypothetical protein